MANDTGGIITVAILYGFFSGGFIALGPTVVVELSPSLNVRGNRMGLLFGPCSIGLLIGNPIGGALLATGWLGLQSFCGGVLVAATCTLVVALLAHRRQRFWEQRSKATDTTNLGQK